MTTGHGYKYIIQPAKTKSSIRTNGLDPITLSTLDRWKKLQREEWLKRGFNTKSGQQLVFPSPSHNGILNLDYMTRIMNRVFKSNNIKPIKIHGLRHTHYSLQFESGASIQEVQSRLDYGDIHTTMNIYAHVTEKQRERLSERFANYVIF